MLGEDGEEEPMHVILEADTDDQIDRARVEVRLLLAHLLVRIAHLLVRIARSCGAFARRLCRDQLTHERNVER